MQTISSNMAKQSLGNVLETAQREPVLIQKHKHPTAVILSVAEYDRLKSGKDSTQPASHPSPEKNAKVAAKSLPVLRKLAQRRSPGYTSAEMVELVKSAQFDEDE